MFAAILTVGTVLVFANGKPTNNLPKHLRLRRTIVITISILSMVERFTVPSKSPGKFEEDFGKCDWKHSHGRYQKVSVEKTFTPEPINVELLFNCIDTDDSSDFSFDELCTEYRCKGESPIHTEEHIIEDFAGTDCVTKC
jgi:hypothetical protein